MSEPVWVKSIDSLELKEANGIAGMWGRLINPEKENLGMIMGLGEIPAGVDMGWHAHAEVEVFFVLQGTGIARWIDKNERKEAKLAPGVAFYKIGGIEHQMVNTGNDTLRGVFFKIKQYV